MRPQTAKATRGRVIFLEILFAASDKRSPKVAAPQAGLHLFVLIAKVITLSFLDLIVKRRIYLK